MNKMKYVGARLRNGLEDFSFKHKLIRRKCSIRGAGFRVYAWHPRPWRLEDSPPLSWMLDNVAERDIVFDIGANRGYYSLAVLAVHPGARVFAFEPNPMIAGKLRRNFELNGWSERARAFDFAVGDKPGTLKLNIALSDSASSFSSEHVRQFGHEIAAVADSRIVPLDSALEEYGLPLPQHIKIDTEGYEKPILLGAKELLRRAHPKLYVEAHPLEPNDGTVSELREILRGYGYKISQKDRFLLCI